MNTQISLQAMLRTGTALIFAILTHAVTACEWGKYGDDCDKRCPKNCQVNPQRNLTHCNKETGECSDGCITGWYDAQCNQHCSKNCLDNVCNHGNGHCTLGCSGNQTGDFCEVPEVSRKTDVKVTTDETTGLSTAHVAVIITLSLVAIIAIIVVAGVIKRRRQSDNRGKSNRRPKAGTDPENPEGEPLLSNILQRETEQVFVETALYHKVKERLERFRHVTISGASGEGKTSMALMLGSEYQKKGYELYFVDDISEFKLSVVSQDKDQCFIFDDIFGTVGMSTDSPHLRRILGCLNSCLEHTTSTVSETYQTSAKRAKSTLTNPEKNMGYTFIIFTTKSYNLKQGIPHLKDQDYYMFFKGASVIDLTQTGYEEGEKRQMFLKHKDNMKYEINDCDLEEIYGIKDNMFGFPLTCKLFIIFLKSHKRYKTTPWTPLPYLRKELNVLLLKMNNESAALILMLLCDGQLNMRQLEIKSSNPVLEDHLSIVSNVVTNLNRSKVITCVRDFFGTYFTKGDITRFSHPSIYDACAFVLYKINPALVLNNCSIRFLYQRVQAQTVPACEIDEDRHVIYVSDVYNDIIASRLAGAIKQGNYRMSIMHPIFERQDIVDKVIDELKQFMTDTSMTDEHGNNMFHYACYSGNVYLVCKLVPFCDINRKGADGLTPTGISALLGLEDLLNLLVSKGADLTLTDDNNDTVLHLACQGGNISVVEQLIPLFDINGRGRHGWTAVMGAALCAKNDVFNLLVSKGADLTLADDNNNTVLHLACQGGNISVVEQLMPLFDINSRGRHGLTGVMGAALCAKKDVFNLLFSKGADLTLTDDYADTILHLACQGGNISVVEQLMPLFDINSRGRDGWTAVMEAALYEEKDTLDLLVSKGADLTLTDDNNNTVLHMACQGGNRSIVEQLLPLFDINSRGRHGLTGVMGAALCAKKDVFNLLVSKGADLTLADDNNNTVLHLACQGGNMSVVEQLMPLFDINSRGRHGWTGVMGAALCAKKDVFNLLVSKGADLTLADDNNNTVLHLACQGGNRSIVEQLLPLFDINSRGRHGWTGVMGAALCAKNDVFNLLFSKGADLTLTDDHNDTVLHLACQGGNRSIVEQLLPLFDINSQGQHGSTAVMKAAVRAKDVFDLLVSKGADLTLTDDYNDNVLHLACQGGNRSIVEHLLPLFDINSRGQHGWTAVMRAALSAKKDTFDLLVSKGADLTLTDDYNNNVLHLSSKGGNRSIVEYLLPLFDINSRGQHSWTAVMGAAVCAKKDTFDLLVSKGADLKLTDDYKDTVLHLACESGNILIVEHLLPMCDIDCRGYEGWTPVMKGAFSGKKDTLDLLLSKGANPSLTGDDNDTLLHAASRGGNIDIVRHVIGDFDINTRGGNGHTPLMRAVCGGHTDVVDFLVEHGADVNMVDNDGDGLLHLACEAGNLKMVKHVMSYSDINLRDNIGWTPLAMAAVEGNFAVFKYLKGLGADVTLTDRAGDDVYTLALQGGCRGIIKELGREEHSDKSITPWNKLMKSLVKSQMFYLKTYSQQSPDLVQTDRFGDSLLHLACRGGNKQCVEYLLPSYDINVRGRYGWTQVMMAAVCGHEDVFQLLVSHKADLSLVSNTGEGITTLARRGNNDAIVQYLLEKY
ncbi:serine/threonine-protein phosphatase 6 regulatory ankyrin repeat subunit A-like [Haliotis cracherodii]|uniref:serine/threonine-protein phosphatase 6 regulatory ankyrin repeat subunit A-like n=1 Tax=Haliotis cracherodii TaxID=6455 RepID=UPI0039E7D62D